MKRKIACHVCGSDDDFHEDGRGNVLCGCQACPDCGILDAYGFHEQDCPQLLSHEEQDDYISVMERNA